MSSSPANESPPRDTGDEDTNKLPSAGVDTPNTNNSGGERGDQDDRSRSRSRDRGGRSSGHRDSRRSRSRSRSRGSHHRRRRGSSRSRSRSRSYDRRDHRRSRSRSRSPRDSRSRERRRDRDHYRDRDRHHYNRDRYGGGYGPPDHHRGGRYDRDYGPPPGYFGPGPGFHGDYPGPPPHRGGGRRNRDEGPPGVSLLVRNVSGDISTNDLQHAFGRIGEVRDVYIPRDFHSQQPKGFAFIEYATPQMAAEAREEMDKFLMKGRELEVVYAQEKRKTPTEMRGRVIDGRSRNGGGGRDRGRGDFQRSSSFERFKNRERETHFRPPDRRD